MDILLNLNNVSYFNIAQYFNLDKEYFVLKCRQNKNFQKSIISDYSKVYSDIIRSEIIRICKKAKFENPIDRSIEYLAKKTESKYSKIENFLTGKNNIHTAFNLNKVLGIYRTEIRALYRNRYGENKIWLQSFLKFLHEFLYKKGFTIYDFDHLYEKQLHRKLYNAVDYYTGNKATIKKIMDKVESFEQVYEIKKDLLKNYFLVYYKTREKIKEKFSLAEITKICSNNVINRQVFFETNFVKVNLMLKFLKYARRFNKFNTKKVFPFVKEKYTLNKYKTLTKIKLFSDNLLYAK